MNDVLWCCLGYFIGRLVSFIEAKLQADRAREDEANHGR